ncbi:MAG TPA: 3-oxoadipate enol-lactonase [Methylibium sp.]|uniref:bifunctional 4-carboxymuconolactone decarboxylase/3-oxoadipate enol-lactonase PcaCD n=1 Tax=Methylibium sp. TaxID=2067992 RepID=UPI002DBC5709|nr:3-oxoadipate enol-lactonase [Methylibium sp.]HEU4460523.1 3-oxoadipate enol-lactonase [Methylibium sp.]
MDAHDHDYERGLRNRRAMLGDAWVDRSTTQSTAFNADFQNFITRYAWHEVWGRPGLAAKTRRVIVLAITCALGRWEEFELHLRAALAGGSGASLGAGDDAASALTPDEVRELLIQAAVYAGVPAANTGMAIAARLLRELGHELPLQPAGESGHPGCGRSRKSRGEPALHCTVREARSGRAAGTIVFSHALGADASMWDAVANRLAATHRVVCYDHRGHGDSAAPPGPYTMAQLTDDAAALLDELAFGPVLWVGLSLGGMVGQELALRAPQRLAALVIANSSARFDEAGREAWLQRIAAIESGGLETIADGTMARWFSEAFRRERPAEVARWRRRIVSNDARAYVAAGHAVREHDALDRLDGIRVPTLVIAGAADAGTPPAMSQAIAARIAGARLELMADVAHLSALEQPAAFSALIERFAAEVAAAVPR